MAVVSKHYQVGVDFIGIADNLHVRFPAAATSSDLNVNRVASLGDFCEFIVPSFFDLDGF